MLAQVGVRPYTEVHVHPDIIGLIVVLGGAYVLAVRVLGPRCAPIPERPVSRFEAGCFAAGLISLWLVLAWPVHDLAEDFLFSAHMVQHLVVMFLAAPLMLLGIPGWLMRAVVGHGRAFEIVRAVTRPFPAFVIGNAALILLHVPPIIAAQSSSPIVHGLMHQAMLVAALVMWMPVLSPMPELPRLIRPLQLLYLFLHSILPTVPGAFITFSDTPLYSHYETTPRLWGMTPLDDQQIAGLVMKIGLGLALWAMITVLFCVWQGDEERSERRPRDAVDEWDGVERAFAAATQASDASKELSPR
jgi:putative membrane protein